MKLFSKLLLSTMLAASAFSISAYAHDDIASVADELPGIGLICHTIKFDGFEISNFHFKDNDQKYIFVQPGEKFTAKMGYKAHPEFLKSWRRHHLVTGLNNDGPQGCVLHTLGVLESEGHAEFTYTAPNKPGVYQVRFCHAQDITDQEAEKSWWRGDGPSAKTIAGIVVVRANS